MNRPLNGKATDKTAISVHVDTAALATKETRADRGKRRGRMLVARAIRELTIAREESSLSVVEVARVAGMSKSALSRLLGQELEDAGVTQLSVVASVLGYEVSLGLHPVGDPVRDKGQLAVAKRLDAILSDKWRITDEALLPGTGEQRAWDKLLRLVGASPRYLVGVDIETRVHDIQALVRRTRGRERDGHVDVILIVLADTAHNRGLADELRSALGPAYSESPRTIMRSLRSGERLVVRGGVVLV